MSTTIELGPDDCALVFRDGPDLQPAEVYLPAGHDDEDDCSAQMKLVSALAILTMKEDFVFSVIEQLHDMVEADKETG